MLGAVPGAPQANRQVFTQAASACRVGPGGGCERESPPQVSNPPSRVRP